MRRGWVVIACFLILLPLSGEAEEKSGKRISVAGDKLSVNVSGSPLFEVLTEIGAETGMEVKVDPEVNKNVTVAFENVSMDRGIARLIHPLDFVIKWKRITEEERQSDVITSVEIFKKGEREKARQVLSPSQPAAAAGRPSGSRPYRSKEEINREDIEKMERQLEIIHRAARTPRKREAGKPRKRYRSTVRAPEESESVTYETGSSDYGGPATGFVRIRTYEVITDTDSYDEL